MNKLRKGVFYPPLLLIIFTIAFSQIDNDAFSSYASISKKWIIQYFGLLFSWSSFLFVIILFIAYFSPIAKLKIGGQSAIPLLNKKKWFAISTTTTIATGILFWGCAEPLYHISNPPINLIQPFSAQSYEFAMSTMFMHWSFTPYAIYCVGGLVFALSYYNFKQEFSVSSMFRIKNSNKNNDFLDQATDVICLYSLTLGMSASLGAGILSIIGGLGEITPLTKSNTLIGIVGFVIILSFIISAISGLQKGIKWLSSINIIGFFFIAVFIFLKGYPIEIIQRSTAGLIQYISTFVSRSTDISSGIDPRWQKDWTVFYWANWFAWAPITSLFLGRIAKGYNVRQFINFNLIFPSIFAIVWMSIFSGSTLHVNSLGGNSLHQLMTSNGEESVMFGMLKSFDYSELTIPFTLILIFLSYVTAADSNISAMSNISETSKEQSKEASIAVKITWGIVIGSLTYIMLSTKGLDGVKILSILGGFPALFIIIAAGFSLLKIIMTKEILKDK